MAEAPRILLEHHLKRLKLPTFLRELRETGAPVREPRAWIMSSSSPDWWNWS